MAIWKDLCLDVLFTVDNHPEIVRILMQYCHNKNMCVMFLMQNIFHLRKYSHCISLKSDYSMVLSVFVSANWDVFVIVYCISFLKDIKIKKYNTLIQKYVNLQKQKQLENREIKLTLPKEPKGGEQGQKGSKRPS